MPTTTQHIKINQTDRLSVDPATGQVHLRPVPTFPLPPAYGLEVVINDPSPDATVQGGNVNADGTSSGGQGSVSVSLTPYGGGAPLPGGASGLDTWTAAFRVFRGGRYLL